MKKTIALYGTCLSFAILTGCTGGTTYGTGSSHTDATVKSMINLLALTPEEKEKIDYSARPELVMPANKQALPAPSVKTVDAKEQWPVSPEQRIAELRAQAVEPHDKSGDLPREYYTNEKVGIRNSARTQRTVRDNRQSGAQAMLRDFRDDARGKGTSAKVRAEREKLAYSTGVKRKFLTEPPTKYRVPSATAEAGDTGVTSKEILDARKKQRKDQINDTHGVIPTNG